MTAPNHLGQAVGFVGLGNQGAPIAHRILDAGFRLTVWARRAGATEAFIAKGADVAVSLEELGARCDHIGICVLDDEDVKQVCAILIQTMAAGSRIAIHSTVLPQTVALLAVQAKAKGMVLIDAPVSGGAIRARAGTLAVMCGGEAADFAAALPILQSFGEEIALLGPAGAGQQAKIINNSLLAANISLAEAALQAGTTLGLDRAALARIMGASSGASNGLRVCTAIATPRDYPSVGLMVKDAGLLAAMLPNEATADLLLSAARPYIEAAQIPN